MSSIVYNEDCVQGMKRFPDKHFDLAIVDPPYGYRTEKTGILNFRQKDKEKNWNIAPSDEYFAELFRVSKNQIVWGGNYFPQLWKKPTRCFIYWHKGNPVPNFADGELAWTSFDENARQFDFRYYGNLEGNTSASNKIHPNQKPVQLYDWCFANWAKTGYKILDTHVGSGSSRISCEKAGLDYTGYETDEDHFNDQEKRFKDHLKQPRLFEHFELKSEINELPLDKSE